MMGNIPVNVLGQFGTDLLKFLGLEGRFVTKLVVEVGEDVKVSYIHTEEILLEYPGTPFVKKYRVVEVEEGKNE